MSSTYYILCLSHDPATVAGECRTPGDAEHRITHRNDEHPHCDLAIGRVSGGLVELGCGGTAGCHHHGTEWVDVDWLRLLAVARQAGDPVVETAARRVRQPCWPQGRIQRLRLELDLPTA